MVDRTIKTITVKFRATKEQLQQAITETKARGEWPVDPVDADAPTANAPPPSPTDEVST